MSWNEMQKIYKHKKVVTHVSPRKRNAFYAPASVDRGHTVFYLLVCLYTNLSVCPQKKPPTLAITFEWCVIELSYFTCVFLVVRLLLWYQGQVLRSFKKMTDVPRALGFEKQIIYLYINPFPNKPWFLRVCSTSLLKTLWEKEKLLVMSNFSFSRSVFLPVWRTFCHFHQTSNCRLQPLLIWKSLKFVVWERVKPTEYES